MTIQEIKEEIKNKKVVFIGEINKSIFEIKYYEDALFWDEEAQKSLPKTTYIVKGWNSKVTKYYFDEADFENRLKRVLKKHGNAKAYPEYTSYWEI